MGLKLLCFSDPEYLELLRNIPDPPPTIWTQGNLDLFKRPAIAMVGARNASSLGTRMTRLLATDLGAAGFTIVSGLARGIDAAAHSAALQTGTIAVQAGGIDVYYPKEKQWLTRRHRRARPTSFRKSAWPDPAGPPFPPTQPHHRRGWPRPRWLSKARCVQGPSSPRGMPPNLAGTSWPFRAARWDPPRRRMQRPDSATGPR